MCCFHGSFNDYLLITNKKIIKLFITLGVARLLQAAAEEGIIYCCHLQFRTTF